MSSTALNEKNLEESQSKDSTPPVSRGKMSGQSEKPAPANEPKAMEKMEKRLVRDDGKVELTEADCYEKLGFCYPTWRKWTILSVIFAVQVSMNLNTSVYSNGIDRFQDLWGISAQAARCGQMIFLVAYAFGCELWAPWSEEFGRKPILQASLFLVNIWQIPCALATNFNMILAFRFLGGLSSAGGSVTLGMVADMWEPDVQQHAVNFVVLSSVGGSALGPLVGAFVQRYLSWHWIFWIQLIFGAAVQVAHLFLVPETRSTILVDKEAKKRRKNVDHPQHDPNVYGPNELKEKRFTVKEVLTIWTRPFYMFATEPIVLCLSLLSGFSDALIFTFIESYGLVYAQWNFGIIAMGLTFIPLLIGYLIGYLSFIPVINRQTANRLKNGAKSVSPETRLWWLLWTVPLEAIGLFGFAWSSLGPAQGVHWIAPMLFSMLVGIANFAIYMATIDYMIASYGEYSASATGGNGFARDFLGGIAALYSIPFYENIGSKYHLEWPSTILAIISIFVAIPVYVFYWKGPQIRARSKFALSLEEEREEKQNQLGRKQSEAARGGVMHDENAERA